MANEKKSSVGAILGTMEGFEKINNNRPSEDDFTELVKSVARAAILQKIKFDVLVKEGMKEEHALELSRNLNPWTPTPEK